MKKRPLTEAEDEALWDEQFAKSQALLAKLADDADLYYARALARSCAEAHVKKLRCAD